MTEAGSEAFGFAHLSYEGHNTVQIKPIFYRLGSDLVDFPASMVGLGLSMAI